jgi:thiamine-monophosphate kinase
MKILRDFRTKGKNSRTFPAFYKKEEDWQEIIKAHLEPIPRLKEVQVLLEEYQPTAMIDISDGLSSEIGHLCEESDLGAYIYLERVPVHIDAEKIAKFAGVDPIEWALQSGEEFELVFTMPREQAEKACDHIRMSTGTEATVIGEMRPKSDGICTIDKDKDIKPLLVKGYDHFKR